MAIGWKDGVNIVIEGLVARLATLEGQVKELEEDKAAKTKKIDDLERELLFGVPASKAETNELQIKEDKVIVNEIFSEIGLSQDAVSMVSLTRIKPNPSRTTTNPPPLRMTLADFAFNYVTIEEILCAARKLKESEKFKKVFINRDLTTVEIVQLKQLIATRNDLNKKLEASNGTSSIATYRYGIRNDRVVKVALEKRLN